MQLLWMKRRAFAISAKQAALNACTLLLPVGGMGRVAYTLPPHSAGGGAGGGRQGAHRNGQSRRAAEKYKYLGGSRRSRGAARGPVSSMDEEGGGASGAERPASLQKGGASAHPHRTPPPEQGQDTGKQYGAECLMMIIKSCCHFPPVGSRELQSAAVQADRCCCLLQGDERSGRAGGDTRGNGRGLSGKIGSGGDP